MNRVRLVCAAVLLALPITLCSQPAFADDSVEMSSSLWHVGDQITVTGPDLYGKYVQLRRLCYAPVVTPDQWTCFGHYDSTNKVWVNDDDQYLTRWDADIITFTVPADLPTKGILRVVLFNDQQSCFDTAGCEDLPTEQDLDVGQFTTVPHIDRILDLATDQPPTAIVAGQSYEIDGSLFGQDNGLISFGSQAVDVPDITSWSSQQIIFKPTKSFNVGGGLKVSNGAEADVFTIGVSASSQSAAASSLSAITSSAASSSATSASPAQFADVTASDPYDTAIEWAKSHGIIQGYPDGTFRPDMVVNRAEFLKIVLTAAGLTGTSQPGSSDFKDVDATAWYAPFVALGKSLGIIQGYADGTFKPDQAVNFAEGLKMAYNSLGVQAADVSGAWYAAFLQDATTNNVLFSNDVDLSAPMSRKDVVWIVWKLSMRTR